MDEVEVVPVDREIGVWVATTKDDWAPESFLSAIGVLCIVQGRPDSTKNC